MTIMPAFSVELVETFHTFKLMGRSGENITDVVAAAEFAEDAFGDGWNSVFNGDEAIDREDWLANGN